MDLLAPLVLILGSILAMSGFIVQKRPDAKASLDKLAPYQVTIGIAMLATGVWWLLRFLSYFINNMKEQMVYAADIMAIIGASILLGALFSLPQIIKLAPGAAPKAQELAAKVVPYQVLIGAVGILASIVYMLFRFHILSMTGIAS